jgi:hypothetical protein
MDQVIPRFVSHAVFIFASAGNTNTHTEQEVREHSCIAKSSIAFHNLETTQYAYGGQSM